MLPRVTTPGEHRFLVDGVIPVLKVHHEPRPEPAVVVLHGLGASTEVQLPELSSLADAGLVAAAIDAPHHGRRRDAWLDELEKLAGGAAHLRFLELLQEAIPEVSRVIDHLQREGHHPVGLLGISLGAFTALGVARADARVACTVSILGSPDWRPLTGEPDEAMVELMRAAPVFAPEATARAPLLLMNAGRDTVVPPDASRAFAHRLTGTHPVEYVEFPESDHLMRPGDWTELWARALRFLRRHLASR
ncbi:MAG: alpha/beta fold hydrolase [Myxococcota bacterium]